MQPTLAAWWQAMVQERASDLQMPLYMLYMWAWEKLFGHSEWVLRMANLPWFVFAVIAFSGTAARIERRGNSPWSLRSPGFVISLFLVLFSPFTWYYLDEARPYAMQIGASLLIASSLLRLAQVPPAPPPSPPRPRSPLIGFCLGAVLLCGSSLLGMIWVAGAVGILFVFLFEHRDPTPRAMVLKAHWLRLSILAVLLLPLTLYYLWTLKMGARASSSSGTGLSNLFFAAYELLGFSCLGPGRLQIRSDGLAALRAHAVPVALYSLSLATVFGAAIASFLQKRMAAEGRSSISKLLVVLFCLLPIVVIVAAGLLAHFRVLGRHFSPVIPVLLLIEAAGLRFLWSARKWWTCALVAFFCILTIYSCLCLRFAPRHQKDDYRTAATIAKVALREGRTVWWNAAEAGARYYQLPTVRSPQPGVSAALLLANPSSEDLARLPGPQVIITSKPDLFDNQFALSNYIRDNGFHSTRQLPAFTLWQR